MSVSVTARVVPKMYGLVRDKDGNPKIDGDPRNLDPRIKELLTADEKRQLGIED